MAGVLTLLSVLYGLCGALAAGLAARRCAAYRAEFACNSGAHCAEDGVEWVDRPRPERLSRRAAAMAALLAAGLASLVVFAVAGRGLDRPPLSTHYTLTVLGRTYQEANVTLYALLPLSAAGVCAAGAFALWRRVQVLTDARVCLTADGLYGVTWEPRGLGGRPAAFELAYGALTRLQAGKRTVTLHARARKIVCRTEDAEILCQKIAAHCRMETKNAL